MGFDPGQGSTTNFFVGVRNVNIDTVEVAADSTISGLNWAVSQGTNLINVNFKLAPDSQHVGIQMDGGSGGGGSGTFLGDLVSHKMFSEDLDSFSNSIDFHGRLDWYSSEQSAIRFQEHQVHQRRHRHCCTAPLRWDISEDVI